MAIGTYVERYRSFRLDAYTWRSELSLPTKVALAVGMACVTGLLAQVRVPLGFTPVPITGQNLGVLLSGIMLGSWFGGLSMLLYLAIGACGVPWFQNGSGGLDYLVHYPTLGYLIGFVLVALLIGQLTDRFLQARGFWGQMGLMYAGMAIILGLGSVYFAATMHTGFSETMTRAFVPFLIGDALKAALAAGVATTLLPKESDRGNRA